MKTATPNLKKNSCPLIIRTSIKKFRYMLRFDIITIFPDMFSGVLHKSIIKRTQHTKKVLIKIHDLRDYTKDKHRKVDDLPFGGGPGMVMTPQPLFDAVKKIKGRRKAKVILTAASGKKLTQVKAK